MKHLKFSVLILFSFTIFLSSCSIFKKMAGADIDPVQFEKARQAKMMEVRYNAQNKLMKRLATGESIENADMTFYLSQPFINKIAKNYENNQGWLDPVTSYTVKSVDVLLRNGCALAYLGLVAHNDKYSVDVDLTMDCVLAIEQKGKDLNLKLEPFNIAPTVKASGIISSAEEIISNLIKINVAKLGDNFANLNIPVDFSNSFNMPETNMMIKDKLNMLIQSPKRKVDFTMKLKEILIFEGRAFVAMNVDKVVEEK